MPMIPGHKIVPVLTAQTDFEKWMRDNGWYAVLDWRGERVHEAPSREDCFAWCEYEELTLFFNKQHPRAALVRQHRHRR